ncbi:hypothetical protein P7K49_006382 [Saguinus oedipus]|uniref:histone acetyltransferase n=1 Tax=Saguinus oedipus TaxID=9490 RepID=A0ABQ9W284_SAGOE|nr:hypothetical protein P7K49_006382 [Saguinus oedipus]
MSSIVDRDDSSIFDGLVEEDDKDKAKRVSRNKSEKKRRDQFNVLIKELGSMLPGNARKMDKSTSDASEIRQDWKPTFLSNEEFTQLMLEVCPDLIFESFIFLKKEITEHLLQALDGFFLAIMTDGSIIYVSESVTSLLEHLPPVENSDLVDQSIFNFIPEGEHSEVYKILSTHLLESDSLTPEYLKCRKFWEEPDWRQKEKPYNPSNKNGYLPFEVLGTSGYDYYHVDDLENLAKCHEHCNYAEVRAERRRELGIEESLPEAAADKVYNRINTVSLKEALERFDHSPTPSASSRSSRKSSHTAVSDPSCEYSCLKADFKQHQPRSRQIRALHPGSIYQLMRSWCKEGHRLVVSLTSQLFQFSAQLGAMQHLKDQLEQRTRMIEANIHRQQEELRKIQEQLQMVHGQGLQMFLQQSNPGLNFGSVQLSSGNSSNIQQLAPINMQGQVVPSNQIQSGMNTGHIGTTQHMIQQQTLQSTSTQSQQNVLGGHSQQTSLPSQTQSTLTAPLYNTMVISQPAAGSMVQIPSSMPQNSTQSAAVTTFTQDRQIRALGSVRSPLPLPTTPAQITLPMKLLVWLTVQVPFNQMDMPICPSNSQIASLTGHPDQFSQGQQLVTKLVTAPVACGAVMVPSTMLMGQVVTAYPTFATQQQQSQTLSVTQQQQQQQQQQSSQEQQLTSVQQPSQAQLTQSPQQFLQVILSMGKLLQTHLLSCNEIKH